MAVRDLSLVHHFVSELFKAPSTRSEWDSFRLSNGQIEFFHQNGFLGQVKLLEASQVDYLKEELEQVADVKHESHHLFYEFHSNESNNPEAILFHALGAWRISKGFHDVLWNPRFLVAAHQLLGEKSVRFWHDQLFCKPPKHGGVV